MDLPFSRMLAGLAPEGVVSKKVDSAYRSGPCRVWIKVRNLGSIAVRRERSPIWLERTICSEGLCGSKTPTVYQRTVLEGRQFDVRPRTEMRSE